jgi:hypothetical protein
MRFGAGAVVFFGVLCLYLLSVGPVLRFGGNTLPNGAVNYPNWVGVLYTPVFSLIKNQLTPTEKRDPVNYYRRYIKWWDESGE